MLLHGDGQYAPEVMGDLVAPIVEGRADAVFGSRMMTKGGARDGGMPMYKYVGNRILTTSQNALTGLRLSEWHSGYRAYRVSALADLPFVGNSDGFDFDTEIILQLHAARKTIVEVPIPTYYGDEICRVNGIAYARDIMVDTLRHRFGRTGFGGGQLGRVAETVRVQAVAAQLARPRAADDAAPSSDARARRRLRARVGWPRRCRRRAIDVTGVDVAEEPGARERMEHFVQADLEHGLPERSAAASTSSSPPMSIEHVRRPEQLLARDDRSTAQRRHAHRQRAQHRPLVPAGAHRGRACSTTTSAASSTRRTCASSPAARSCASRIRSGLEPLAHRHTGLPFDALGRAHRSTPRAARSLVDRLLVRAWPTMFAYQFVYELAVSPALDVATDASHADAPRSRRSTGRPGRSRSRRRSLFVLDRLPMAAVGPVRPRPGSAPTSTTSRPARSCAAVCAVRPEVAGHEGFLIDGRTYLYYGPFLAIVRLPFALFGDVFAQRLTRLSMIVGFVVYCTGAFHLLDLARRWASRSLARPDRVRSRRRGAPVRSSPRPRARRCCSCPAGSACTTRPRCGPPRSPCGPRWRAAHDRRRRRRAQRDR